MLAERVIDLKRRIAAQSRKRQETEKRLQRETTNRIHERSDRINASIRKLRANDEADQVPHTCKGKTAVITTAVEGDSSPRDYCGKFRLRHRLYPGLRNHNGCTIPETDDPTSEPNVSMSHNDNVWHKNLPRLN